MFTPYFTITPKITKDLEAIGAVFGYFRAVQLPENYQKELVFKATAETVHSSTAIEGNTLTVKQVELVLSGKKITAESEDIKEVINYHKALSFIGSLAKKSGVAITENLIQKVNRFILKGIKDDIAGKYRTGQVVVGDYLPPEHVKVPSLMQELAKWLKDPRPLHLSPILYTGITHCQLVAIHPFLDGNGRTSRIITTLMLIQHNYEHTRFFALESYYNRDRKSYYQALSSVDKDRVKGKPDLTRWLEYYVGGMLIEAERARSQIEELLEKNRLLGEKVWLSDAQMKILQLTVEKASAKIADYLTVSHLSRKGTYNAIEKLVQLRLLKRSGEGKGTYYTITEKGLTYVR